MKTAALREVLGLLVRRLKNRRGFFRAWGMSVTELAREKALSHGGRTLWPGIARATRLLSSGEGSALIGCSHVAAAQKEYGGVIEARNARCLTIPIHPLSRNRRASEFADRGLFVLRGRSGAGVLGFRSGERFIGLYALVRRTRPQRAERWWPTRSEALGIGIRLGGAMLGRR